MVKETNAEEIQHERTLIKNIVELLPNVIGMTPNVNVLSHTLFKVRDILEVNLD